MRSEAVEHEFERITVRTRRWVGGSTIVHLLLLLLLAYHQNEATATTGITEITWVENVPPPPTAPPEITAPPMAREEIKRSPIQRVLSKIRRSEPTKQFKRELKRSTLEPTPQSPKAVEDVLTRKLDTSNVQKGAASTSMSSMLPPPKIGKPTPAAVPDAPKQASPRSDLTRDTKPVRGTPTELNRVQTPTKKPSAIATVPTTPTTSRKATPETAPSDAVRYLAGAKLAGQVADRELVSYEKPVYPEWAKTDGVEGSVTLRFYVLSDGRVKDNIFVEKTSGFSDFDGNAVAALRTWRFEALPGASEQWGVITFHFRLSDG
jgi:TonB family protein